MNSKELNALIQLLDDNEPVIDRIVMNHFLELGKDIVPVLEQAHKYSKSCNLQFKLDSIIDNIYVKHSIDQIHRWMIAGSKDILEGMFCLCTIQYSGLRFVDISNQVDQISDKISLAINENMNVTDKVKVINKFFYSTFRFTLDSNYYYPHNSLINHVLVTRKGNDLSLSVLYSLICRRLELPVYVISLQGKNLMAMMESNGRHPIVSYYIDTANNGVIMSEDDVRLYSDINDVDSSASMFMPCSNVDIIKKLTENIIRGYFERNDLELVKYYESLYNEISAFGNN